MFVCLLFLSFVRVSTIMCTLMRLFDKNPHFSCASSLRLSDASVQVTLTLKHLHILVSSDSFWYPLNWWTGFSWSTLCFYWCMKSLDHLRQPKLSTNVAFSTNEVVVCSARIHVCTHSTVENRIVPPEYFLAFIKPPLVFGLHQAIRPGHNNINEINNNHSRDLCHSNADPPF